jgi:NAD(P)-dependent dehydrogenase (short-subunit alcohol dehydrogenase family)
VTCRPRAVMPLAATRRPESSRTLAGNPDVSFLSSDLSSQDEVRRLAAWVGDGFGGLSVLVNNAAVVSPRRRETVDGRDYPWPAPTRAVMVALRPLLHRLREARREFDPSSDESMVA